MILPRNIRRGASRVMVDAQSFSSDATTRQTKNRPFDRRSESTARI